VKTTEETVFASLSLRALANGVTAWRLGTAVASPSTGTTGTAGASLTSVCTQALVSLLNDRRVTDVRFNRYVNVESGAAVAPFAAHTAEPTGSALASVTWRLLVVPITAILTFAAHAANTPLSTRLAIPTGQYQSHVTVRDAWDNELHALRGVAAVLSVLSRSPWKSIFTLMPIDSWIVMIPP
jgi:hypothetical protein